MPILFTHCKCFFLNNYLTNSLFTHFAIIVVLFYKFYSLLFRMCHNPVISKQAPSSIFTSSPYILAVITFNALGRSDLLN